MVTVGAVTSLPGTRTQGKASPCCATLTGVCKGFVSVRSLPQGGENTRREGMQGIQLWVKNNKAEEEPLSPDAWIYEMFRIIL